MESIENLKTNLDYRAGIDECHGEFISSLVRVHKPEKLLLLGLGTGISAKMIIQAMQKNEDAELHHNYKTAHLTIVDNWRDWSGEMPTEAKAFEDYATVITSNEMDFVFESQEQFNFIFSDADHFNTDKWFDYVYDRLLTPNGILIYHDVSIAIEGDDFNFPNMKNIWDRCCIRGISHVHFDKSSLKSERCSRGLLAIFKNQIERVHALKSAEGRKIVVSSL